MGHRLLFTLIVFLTVANLLVWSLLGLEKAYANRVYPGVWVQAQPLSGLTKDQVIDRLKPMHDALLLEQVTLTLGDKQYQPTLADLGYQVNTGAMAEAAIALGRGPTLKQVVLSVLDYRKTKTIPLIYEVDQGKFDNYLNEIGKAHIKEPKNLSLDYQNGEVVTVPAEEGVVLDKQQIREAIQRQVQPGKGATVALSYSHLEPSIREESQVAQAKQELVALLAKPLKLQAEEVTLELTPTTIFSFVYFESNGELSVHLSDDAIRGAVANLAKKVDITPVPKRVSTVNNTLLEEGRDGRELDGPDTLKRIRERLQNKDFETPLILSVKKLERKVVTISPEYQLGRYPDRYIEIDLSAQRLHLLESDAFHRTFLISTGKWDMPTPTGELQIHNHIRTAFSRRYGLFMDYWMAVTPDGAYGLHQLPRWPSGKVEGTSHLGRPVSHGCIRLGPGDAEYLYAWAENGTKVFIHE